MLGKREHYVQRIPMDFYFTSPGNAFIENEGEKPEGKNNNRIQMVLFR